MIDIPSIFGIILKINHRDKQREMEETLKRRKNDERVSDLESIVVFLRFLNEDDIDD